MIDKRIAKRLHRALHDKNVCLFVDLLKKFKHPIILDILEDEELDEREAVFDKLEKVRTRKD